MIHQADNLVERGSKAPEGWAHSKTLPRVPAAPASAKRLECGGFSAAFRPRQDQPFVLRPSSLLHIYFDHCIKPQYYGAIKSTDMKAWQDISPVLTFPKGIRPGTLSMVPESMVEQIQIQ